MTKIKRLEVGTEQGHAGRLDRESQFVFNYETTTRDCEVALNMPLRAASYTGNTLPAIFAMNLPEGYLHDRIVQRFAKHVKLDEMRLLSIIGSNQIGRLSFAIPDVAPEVARPQVGLRELLEGGHSPELFEFLVDAYLGSGISGVQPKVLIPDADAVGGDGRRTMVHSNLIIKAGGGEYPGLAINEFLCMEAARRAGIETPPFYLSNDGELFVMSRFDLEDGRALGFEDMAVLMGRNYEPTGNYKYQGSYEQMAVVIQGYCRESAAESLARLFEYVTLSVMVRNGDAHLKNFGLLYSHPDAESAPRLAPLYDVVTTTAYDHIHPGTGRAITDRILALKLNKEKTYPNKDALVTFGRDVCKVRRPAEVIERIATAMSKTLTEHGHRLSAALRSRIQREWDAGRLLRMDDRKPFRRDGLER